MDRIRCSAFVSRVTILVRLPPGPPSIGSDRRKGYDGIQPDEPSPREMRYAEPILSVGMLADEGLGDQHDQRDFIGSGGKMESSMG